MKNFKIETIPGEFGGTDLILKNANPSPVERIKLVFDKGKELHFIYLDFKTKPWNKKKYFPQCQVL